MEHRRISIDRILAEYKKAAEFCGSRLEKETESREKQIKERDEAES